MKLLKYCPSCGKESLQWDNEKKWSCPECGFTLYNNVAGAVAVVIRCGDEIYLQEETEILKGKTRFAGGFVDPKKVQKKHVKENFLRNCR
jgi:NADH pyrophosphatase NudC (nudix superfamily)